MKRRRGTAALMSGLAALAALISALLTGLAAASRREMLHERLTYSQWYEDAARCCRRWSLSAAIAVLTALALWCAVLLRRRRALKAKREIRQG